MRSPRLSDGLAFLIEDVHGPEGVCSGWGDSTVSGRMCSVSEGGVGSEEDILSSEMLY